MRRLGVAAALLGLALATALAVPPGAAGAQPPPGTPSAAEAVRVDAPRPGALVAGRVVVTGAARGGWFFEASFPLRLLGPDGGTLAEGFASAEGEWMTPEFVPFRGELRVPEGASGPARLVLERANPSGLPENAAAVEIPLRLIGPK